MSGSYADRLRVVAVDLLSTSSPTKAWQHLVCPTDVQYFQNVRLVKSVMQLILYIAYELYSSAHS